MYLFSVHNISQWVQMITTCILIRPAITGHMMCLTEWRSGWISAFLAWINFIMYLRRYFLQDFELKNMHLQTSITALILLVW